MAVERVKSSAWRKLALELSGIAVLALTIAFALDSLDKKRREVEELAERIADVAKGGGDLTRRLEVRRTDEIGRVMHRFNEFLATLQGIVQQIVKDSRSLATSTALLHESEERIATTSREMSGKTMSVSVIAEKAPAVDRGNRARQFLSPRSTIRRPNGQWSR